MYPSDFRDEYGREMVLVFADRHRDAEGFSEHAKVWASAISGLLKEAPKEHIRMIGQDLQYARRTFRMNPGFVATVVMTLALGIGASTTVFTLLDRVLLRVLPVAKPHELVQVASPPLASGAAGETAPNSHIRCTRTSARTTRYSRGRFADFPSRSTWILPRHGHLARQGPRLH